MAIPTPGVPSTTNPISSVRLVPTTSRKCFYTYSGEMSIGGSETTMISIQDTGKRDVLVKLHVSSISQSSDDYAVRVKMNGQSIIEENLYRADSASRTGMPIDFIIPKDCSLEITMDNISTGTANDWFASIHGYFL